MLRTLIGGLVGKEMGRRGGRSGLKGAALGMIAVRAVTRTGPLGLLLGGGYVAKKMMDRRRTGAGTTTR